MIEERFVAYCGLVCSDCPAFIATQTEDVELLTRTAERWSTATHRVEPKEILCDGCAGNGTRLTAFCSVCTVRKCARKREVTNCALCPEYACLTLEKHWQRIKAKDEAKPVLDQIRRRS